MQSTFWSINSKFLQVHVIFVGVKTWPKILFFQHVSARNPPEVPSSTGSQALSRAQRWACELLATIKMAPLREQLFGMVPLILGGEGQSHRFSQTSPAFRLIFL